ncbi:MAG: ABC-three component system middle component 1 [Colwellia sp.]
MNNLVQSIFEFYGYTDIGNSNFHLFKSNTMDDFWLVHNGEPELFDYETQSNLLSQCKEFCQNKSLEKNLNLLCLWEVPSINKSIASRLHHLEEDLYFFKKHVLYFTDLEHEELKLQLNTLSLHQLLTEQLINPSTFKNYKNKNIGSWESLLYRIAIKLTFLSVSPGNSGELTELYSSHSQRLSKKESLILLDEVVQGMDSQFDLSDPEALINYINHSMEDML